MQKSTNQIKPIKSMPKNYQIIKRNPEGDQKLKLKTEAKFKKWETNQKFKKSSQNWTEKLLT